MLRPFAIFQPPIIEKDNLVQRRYQIRLLFYSLVAIVASTSFMMLVVYLIGRLGVFEALAGGVVIGGALLGLVLMRYQAFTAASLSFVLTFTASTTLYLATNQGLDDPYMLVLTLVLVEGILLLEKRWGYAFLGIIIGITGLLHLLVPNTNLDVLLLQAIAFGLTGFLLRYGLNVLDNSLQETQTANDELRMLGQKQDELVRVRTRELALAVQVGNEIARLRDVQELLQKTVDAVRTNFGLYHAQIYLADAAGRTLSLQAGTGVVGRELVEQSHRLPIGPGSINGTAAARREPVIVADTRQSPLFRPNPLLPETRSELAIPLIVSERVLGVLNLQSSEVGGLSESAVASFQLLGGQIAIAIENANLFTQVTRTQEELMAQARRLTKANWQEYLTHLDESSQLSYSYSLEDSTPTSTPSHITIHEAAYVMPIKVIDQTVGYIQVQGGDDYRWNDEDAELVQAVANQVAQQVENLRLLQESERYRAEAEAVLQRLTKDAWRDFLGDAQHIPTYLGFNGTQITADLPTSGNRQMQAPLLVRGESIGNLLVDSSKLADNQDRELVTAVASRLSGHIENLRLARQNDLALAETQRRSEELALLNRVVTAVTTEKDLNTSLNRVVTELSQILEVGRVGIALFNSDQTMLTVAAESNTDSTGIGTPIPVKGNASTEEVLRTRQTLVIQDAQNDPLTSSVHQLFREQSITSIAILPFIVGTDIIGTVGVAMTSQERQLTADKIALAETLIRQTGTAIQNLRLVEQSQKRAEELSLLNKVAEAVASQLDTYQLLQTIFAEVSKLLPTDSFYVGLYDEASASMSYPFYYEDKQTVTIPLTPLPEYSLSYKVISTGQPVVIDETPEEVVTFDFEQDEFYEGHKSAAPTPSASCIFVPLRQGNQIVGVMSAQTYQSHAYTNDDVKLLLGVANYFTVALQNAQLFSQTQKRAEQLAALNQVAEAVSSQLNVAQLIETIFEQVQNTIPLDAFQVGLYDAQTDTIEYPLVIDQEIRHTIPPHTLKPVSKAYKVIQTGQPYTYGEAPQDMLTFLPDQEEFVEGTAVELPNPTQSAIFVPLRRGTRTVGVISVQSYQKNAYTNDDLSLLTGVANYFTVALQNASLFAQTQKRVSQLDAINHVAQSVGQQLDETGLLETISNQVQGVIPYDTFYVGLYDKAQNSMSFPIFYEDGNKKQAPVIQVAPHSYTRRIIDEKRPFLIIKEPSHENPAIVPTGLSVQDIAERVSLVFVPLTVGLEVIGVMSVQSKLQKAYSEDDMTLLSGIASYFTVAWQNASLYAQTRKRAERERLVNEIAQQIQRTVSVESALQTAAQALGRALQTSQTEISLSN
ncbi:MAG: GAF domain-containing protein [Chloroflexi bacterium]|nr:GAF domain-containing protein [Chloroflexota bacterium]